MSLIESYISHQIWLQRNASQEVNELAPFIQQMRDEVRSQVLSMGDDNRTKTRLVRLLKDLNDALYGVTGDWDEQLRADLKNLAIYETNWNISTLENSIPNVSFTTPSPEQISAAINFAPLQLEGNPTNLDGLIKGWQAAEVNRLTMGVKMGFVQGLTTRQIVKNVTGTGGLADISQRHAATVVRTALNHISTEAKNVIYEKNSDVIEGYELVVTLDSRTSNICKGWPPGKVYKPSDKFRPMPPFHPNCRTTTAPVVSSEYDFLDEGAVRAARGADGGTQVDAKTSYYDFLKQQPAWFQDEALGPVRGKIFRNSGISPEEFRTISVDGFGRPLTLNEMADLDKRVADYLKGL